jgi:two-component system phosphate regulon sensor histidine kinase PhoR
LVYFCCGMTKRRINISIIVMFLAIAAILSFQSEWIYKYYKEEQQNLRLRTNTLFRESVIKCQEKNFKFDSVFKDIRFAPKTGAIISLNLMKDQLRDTMYRKIPKDNSFVIVNSSSHPRKFKTYFRSSVIDTALPGKNVLKLFEGVDSLQDTVSIKDVQQKFKDVMTKERINVPYTISRTNNKFDTISLQRNDDQNEITLGFVRPYTFRLDLENTVPYILRKLTPQILVSVLLVALTVLSFVLLLRNLIQQRKLTQIKNDFISNITHELKTPIATVSVAIEALKNFNALHDPQRTREYLDISGNELQRLSLLVDKVLKLSMFEKQQIELKKEAFDSKLLVEEVLASMRLQFEKYNAQVNVETQGSDFSVVADRLHFTSVIFNLLDNALKYSKANPSIQVALKDLPGQLEMSVTDNGIGMTTENQKRIFEKFYRVTAGDTHNVKGYGLGLSYVAYVVQRHGGTIQVESQQGIGSRFIIRLPKENGKA